MKTAFVLLTWIPKQTAGLIKLIGIRILTTVCRLIKLIGIRILTTVCRLIKLIGIRILTTVCRLIKLIGIRILTSVCRLIHEKKLYDYWLKLGCKYLNRNIVQFGLRHRINEHIKIEMIKIACRNNTQ